MNSDPKLKRLAELMAEMMDVIEDCDKKVCPGCDQTTFQLGEDYYCGIEGCSGVSPPSCPTCGGSMEHEEGTDTRVCSNQNCPRKNTLWGDHYDKRGRSMYRTSRNLMAEAESRRIENLINPPFHVDSHAAFQSDHMFDELDARDDDDDYDVGQKLKEIYKLVNPPQILPPDCGHCGIQMYYVRDVLTCPNQACVCNSTMPDEDDGERLFPNSKDGMPYNPYCIVAPDCKYCGVKMVVENGEHVCPDADCASKEGMPYD